MLWNRLVKLAHWSPNCLHRHLLEPPAHHRLVVLLLHHLRLLLSVEIGCLDLLLFLLFGFRQKVLGHKVNFLVLNPFLVLVLDGLDALLDGRGDIMIVLPVLLILGRDPLVQNVKSDATDRHGLATFKVASCLDLSSDIASVLAEMRRVTKSSAALEDEVLGLLVISEPFFEHVSELL